VAAVLAVLAAMFVLVGIAGVPLGRHAPETGWWLDLVGIFLGLAAFVMFRMRRRRI
jgi:membrane associated rhomboid family serine protease